MKDEDPQDEDEQTGEGVKKRGEEMEKNGQNHENQNDGDGRNIRSSTKRQRLHRFAAFLPIAADGQQNENQQTQQMQN